MNNAPLSQRQRNMIAKIGSVEWVPLKPLDIQPKDTTLLALRKRGLVQVRHTKVLMEPESYEIHEVRLVETEHLTDNLKAAVKNLIDSMTPVVRKLLAKQIVEVNQYMK